MTFFEILHPQREQTRSLPLNPLTNPLIHAQNQPPLRHPPPRNVSFQSCLEIAQKCQDFSLRFTLLWLEAAGGRVSLAQPRHVPRRGRFPWKHVAFRGSPRHRRREQACQYLREGRSHGIQRLSQLEQDEGSFLRRG